jgi:hypothetical protein
LILNKKRHHVILTPELFLLRESTYDRIRKPGHVSSFICGNKHRCSSNGKEEEGGVEGREGEDEDDEVRRRAVSIL